MGETMNKKSEDKIRKWLLRTIESGTWRNFDDLHVDEIDRKYKTNTTWIQGGIESLEIASDALRKLGLDKDHFVQLCIYLKSSPSPTKPNFSTMSDLFDQLSWTPPSLYVFQKWFEKWRFAMDKAAELKHFHIGLEGAKIYYSESFDSEELEYLRFLYVLQPHLEVDYDRVD
jgi:hypothetical protein